MKNWLETCIQSLGSCVETLDLHLSLDARVVSYLKKHSAWQRHDWQKNTQMRYKNNIDNITQTRSCVYNVSLEVFFSLQEDNQITTPKINMSHEKEQCQKEISSSKNQFWGQVFSWVHSIWLVGGCSFPSHLSYQASCKGRLLGYPRQYAVLLPGDRGSVKQEGICIPRSLQIQSVHGLLWRKSQKLRT